MAGPSTWLLPRIQERWPQLTIVTIAARAAEAALRRGAHIVNDISGANHDPQMLPVCAEAGCGLCLMHMRGGPRDMQSLAEYDDVVDETKQWLLLRAEAAVAAGVAEDRILLDPGLGFAKTADHNLEILARLAEYGSLGFPIVVGA